MVFKNQLKDQHTCQHQQQENRRLRLEKFWNLIALAVYNQSTSSAKKPIQAQCLCKRQMSHLKILPARASNIVLLLFDTN